MGRQAYQPRRAVDRIYTCTSTTACISSALADCHPYLASCVSMPGTQMFHMYISSTLLHLIYKQPQNPGLLFRPARLASPLSLGPSIAPPIAWTGTLFSFSVPPSFLIIASLAFAAPGLSQPNSWLGWYSLITTVSSSSSSRSRPQLPELALPVEPMERVDVARPSWRRLRRFSSAWSSGVGAAFLLLRSLVRRSE